MNRTTRQIAEYGILTALCLVLGYAESLIPAFFAVPGMKLGLTNLVIVVTLYKMGNVPAILLNFIRILLSALLFGTVVSLWYSLAGGLLSIAVMCLLKQSGKFHCVTVSIAGAVSHNVGQIIVAMLLMRTTGIGWYLFILWFTGMASGALIGLLGGEIVRRLEKVQAGGKQ